VDDLIETRVIEVVPRDTYASLEQAATERMPRDQRDWPTVALAMVLDAGILTGVALRGRAASRIRHTPRLDRGRSARVTQPSIGAYTLCGWLTRYDASARRI
jgi:predicted nucleic acid-binding protein